MSNQEFNTDPKYVKLYYDDGEYFWRYNNSNELYILFRSVPDLHCTYNINDYILRINTDVYIAVDFDSVKKILTPIIKYYSAKPFPYYERNIKEIRKDKLKKLNIKSNLC